MTLQNVAAYSMTGTLILTLPGTAPFVATSNGLPPPPNASGFDFELSVRWASEVRTVATPWSTAVVGWNEGDGADVMLDCEDAIVLLEVVVVVEVSLLEEEEEEDDDVDVSAAVLSTPVDEGAGPFPSTLLGHR